MVQSAIAVADRESAAPPAATAGAGGDLLKLFASVWDGRPGQEGDAGDQRRIPEGLLRGKLILALDGR